MMGGIRDICSFGNVMSLSMYLDFAVLVMK
jgi:hypothetical protein